MREDRRLTNCVLEYVDGKLSHRSLTPDEAVTIDPEYLLTDKQVRYIVGLQSSFKTMLAQVTGGRSK